MIENPRRFRAGPDPFGRTWQVDLLWLQTAISIRHADAVDVKFLLSDGESRQEKVISLRHPDLLALSGKTSRPLTDAWCMRLAARHLARMIETGEDFEKTLVTVSPEELEQYNTILEEAAVARE
mgnify:CR=1 FL=1